MPIDAGGTWGLVQVHALRTAGRTADVTTIAHSLRVPRGVIGRCTSDCSPTVT